MEAEEMVKMVYAIYKANFGGCNWIREDMIQEGLLGILAAEKLYDESRGVSLYTFAWNYAKGRMMNYYQKERTYRGNMCSIPDLDIYSGADLDYSERSDKSLKVERIKKELVGIDDRTRAIFLDIINGKKQKEIAKELGISRQLVNMKYKRTIEKIRKKIL